MSFHLLEVVYSSRLNWILNSVGSKWLMILLYRIRTPGYSEPYSALKLNLVNLIFTSHVWRENGITNSSSVHRSLISNSFLPAIQQRQGNTNYSNCTCSFHSFYIYVNSNDEFRRDRTRHDKTTNTHEERTNQHINQEGMKENVCKVHWQLVG